MPQPPMSDELKEQLLQAKMITFAAQSQAVAARNQLQAQEINGS